MPSARARMRGRSAPRNSSCSKLGKGYLQILLPNTSPVVSHDASPIQKKNGDFVFKEYYKRLFFQSKFPLLNVVILSNGCKLWVITSTFQVTRVLFSNVTHTKVWHTKRDFTPSVIARTFNVMLVTFSNVTHADWSQVRGYQMALGGLRPFRW